LFYLFNAGANIESILDYPKQFLKKINLYICILKSVRCLLQLMLEIQELK
jgi:hypothetical protein